MISATEENYLKALFHLENEQGEATANELSKALDIRMSTVSSMMKRLSDKGLVEYESYKPMRLTEQGRREAGLILRKHRLTEMFLVQIMNFGWEEVHIIAEQIEHLQSHIFFERMSDLLGNPTIDPHGSPIPDKEGKIDIADRRLLSDAEVGERVKFIAVADSSKELLEYLSRRELELDTLINVVEKVKFDGNLTIEYKNRQEVLSKLVCDKLQITSL